MANNVCGTCFNCCKRTLIKVSDEDVLRWKKEQRYDIILCLTQWHGGCLAFIHKDEKT